MENKGATPLPKRFRLLPLLQRVTSPTRQVADADGRLVSWEEADESREWVATPLASSRLFGTKPSALGVGETLGGPGLGSLSNIQRP